MKLNPKLAELIGMHVEDGSLYKTSRGIVWELRGDLKEKLLRWERDIKPKNSKFLKKISEWKNKTKYFYAGIA